MTDRDAATTTATLAVSSISTPEARIHDKKEMYQNELCVVFLLCFGLLFYMIVVVFVYDCSFCALDWTKEPI